MISIIVAVDRAGAIGKLGRIPWKVREDLQFFQRETVGGAVIMGRRTWESLPTRPLRQRLNLVVSSGVGISEHVFSHVTDAIGYAYGCGYSRIYAIGGRQIYEEVLPLANRLLISRVDTIVSEADTWFPDYDKEAWRLVRNSTLRSEAPRCDVDEFIRI